MRDEGEAALQKLREEQEARHRAELQRLGAEQLSITEKLRRELAQAHLDKFNAMATELNQAHQVCVCLWLFVSFTNKHFIFFNGLMTCVRRLSLPIPALCQLHISCCE